ncbi:hypothetical protein MNEG_2400 [Monoraphidium neglectum]|uniref:Uncharacterized protein n=1 Tax=Monoraphidium neglectum TaxID=145388 RepID=A0A0D2NLG5_9CHLO|nr:hypothetical protein MNEG_2400 [Monoraphidium neglectum]KIZ05561.1 hypothetical protein MNEG_2400 [Monoraphidium neglectum]|eukprot:XP_013904580.1 hypothetical protein MNEG_2400 [Monoraphidium neglectum]
MDEAPNGSVRHLEAGPDSEGAAESRPSKRPRLDVSSMSKGKDDVDILLYVRWLGPSSGQTKVIMLPLRPVASVDDLQDLGKELVHKAYPQPQPLPGWLTSPDYCRFTPSRECLAVPGELQPAAAAAAIGAAGCAGVAPELYGSLSVADRWGAAVRRAGSYVSDIIRTELRLVLVHEGWEYCVLKRTLSPAPQPQGDMLVTAVEFEGRPEEAILGTLGFRVSLIAYPIIALRKAFLEEVTGRLLGDPAAFQGIL